MIGKKLNERDYTILENITSLFEMKKYYEAYQILQKYKEYDENIIKVFTTFCLIKLENFPKAFKEAQKIKYEKELKAFLLPIVLLYNKPIDFNINHTTNIYQKYLYALLNNNYEIMLTTECNKYKEIELFTYIHMTFKNEKVGETFLLKKLIEEKIKDFSLFYLLISNSLCCDEIFVLLKQAFQLVNNEIYYTGKVVTKNVLSDRFFIISILYIFLKKDYDITKLVYNDITLIDILYFLHLNLPNSGLYKFIEKKLFDDSNTENDRIRLNEMFLRHKNKINLIVSEHSIYEIENNLNLENNEIKSFRENNLNDLVLLYKQRNLKNTKLLISLLIGTKKLENIIYALYISYQKYTHSNYEYKLIYTFILRLLCNLHHLELEYKKINPSEIQILNLGFILSDLAILKQTEDSQIRDFLFNTIYSGAYKIKQKVLDNLLTFVINKKYMEAVSLLRVFEKVNNSRLLIEINEWKISSINPNSQFLNLLGNKCKYLFKKVCLENTEEFSFFNIFSLKGEKFKLETFTDNFKLGIFQDDGFLKILKEIENQQAFF